LAEPLAVARALRADPVDPDAERDGALGDEQRAERVQHQVVTGRQLSKRDHRVDAAGGQPGLPALDLADLGLE
jgi:hypothetical protein